MPRSTKSQWDFGELFEPGALRRVLTVAELTTQVRQLLESRLGSIWVTGEVTNLRAQASGHLYFSIKDARSQLQCVCFRDEARATRHLLKDGQTVVVQGEVTVYEQRGQYQLLVRTIELQGEGALQAAFEQLKQRLSGEGLFSPERKRPLPRFVQRIGLVTSPTGAALQDVLHVVERRHPALEIIFVPCRVQGQGAASEIAAAIRLLNRWSATAGQAAPTRRPAGELTLEFPEGHYPLRRRLDLILVTRGGGSLEDLWAFNEEVVARAIHESALPVVSAVGHEIDFTISDFVADVRAATPSAAAEIITESAFTACRLLESVRERLSELLARRLETESLHVRHLWQRLLRTHPRRRFNEQLQYLDDLLQRMGRCTRRGWQRHQGRWQVASLQLARLQPRYAIQARRETTTRSAHALEKAAHVQLREKRMRLETLVTRLQLLSPEKILQRGYSITRDAATGAILRNAEAVQPGQQLITRLQSGEVTSVVSGSSKVSPLEPPKPRRPRKSPPLP